MLREMPVAEFWRPDKRPSGGSSSILLLLCVEFKWTGKEVMREVNHMEERGQGLKITLKGVYFFVSFYKLFFAKKSVCYHSSSFLQWCI